MWEEKVKGDKVSITGTRGTCSRVSSWSQNSIKVTFVSTATPESKEVQLKFVFLVFVTLELYLSLWVYEDIWSKTASLRKPLYLIADLGHNED